MEEVIPRLANAMQWVLADAQIQVAEQQSKFDLRFDGLPAWQLVVTRHPITSDYQMIETHIDLFPLCIASLSKTELQRLTASENYGLRGVTVSPLHAEQNDDRSGLRVRTRFVAQKGESEDEVENLTVDILTVLSFARTLEDRLTENAVAGEFSFELYNSRFEGPNAALTARFVRTDQNIFEGSSERVFHEVMSKVKPSFPHELRNAGARSTIITVQDSQPLLEIVAKIPDEVAMFIAHAPLLNLTGMDPAEVWAMLEELNSSTEVGHFELNSNDMILCFTTWKHLTNDLRQFSFEHAIAAVNNAFRTAAN